MSYVLELSQLMQFYTSARAKNLFCQIEAEMSALLSQTLETAILWQVLVPSANGDLFKLRFIVCWVQQGTNCE